MAGKTVNGLIHVMPSANSSLKVLSGQQVSDDGDLIKREGERITAVSGFQQRRLKRRVAGVRLEEV